MLLLSMPTNFNKKTLVKKFIFSLLVQMNGLFFSFEKILDHFELFYILNSSVSLTSQVPNDFVQIFNNKHEKNMKSINFHAVGMDLRRRNIFFRKNLWKNISKSTKKEKLICTHHSIPNTIYNLRVLDSVGVKIKISHPP